MRDCVRKAFVGFTAPLEGVTTWMYLDILGYVTTGIGNLIDTVGEAVALPWKRPDGSLASRAEVEDEWRYVKSLTSLMLKGGGIFQNYTSLRLDLADVDRLVSARLSQMDIHLAQRFGHYYTDAPADGQLGLLSMSWAAGPMFRYPKLVAHLKAGNWEGVAAECDLRAGPGNLSLKHRNTANKTLFRNAGQVIAQGLDRDTLYYPQVLA